MSSRARVCAAGAFVLLFGGLSAQAAWTPLGPEGGTVAALAVDPQTPTRIYAIGNDGLFRSTDGALSWSRADNGMTDVVGGLSAAFAINPNQPATLYVVSNAGRLFRSVDAGASWTPTGYSSTPSSVSEIDVAPVSGAIYLAANDGVRKSTDGGVTFAPANTGLPSDRGSFSLVVDPQAPTHLIVSMVRDHEVPTEPVIFHSEDAGASWTAAQDIDSAMEVKLLSFGSGTTVYAASTSGVVGLYRSDDGGAHWTNMPGGGSVPIKALAASTQVSGHVVFGTAAGLRVSSDGGATSALANDGLAATTTQPAIVSAIALHPNYPITQDVWLGTEQLGVFTRALSASAWQSRNSGFQSMPLRAMTLHPRDGQRIFAGAFVEHAGSVAGDLLRVSSNSGASWGGRLGDVAGYLRAIVIDPTTAGDTATTHIYAAGRYDKQRNAGLYKSTDGGQSWSLIQNGLPTAGSPPLPYIGPVRNVSLDPRSCATPPAQGTCTNGPLRTLYATATGRGDNYRVVKSVDAGLNWTDSTGNLPPYLEDDAGGEGVIPLPLLVDPTQPSVIYLGTFIDFANNDGSPRIPSIASGVFRSGDGGVSWQHRSNGLLHYAGSTNTAGNVYALAMHPRNPAVLWAGASIDNGPSGTIYKTIDAGLNWAPSGTGITNCLVRDIRVDRAAPSVLYAAGYRSSGVRGCIFRSEDGGSSWTSLQDNLPSYAVSSVQIDPNNQGHIVVGTSSGVYETQSPPDAIFSDVQSP